MAKLYIPAVTENGAQRIAAFIAAGKIKPPSYYFDATACVLKIATQPAKTNWLPRCFVIDVAIPAGLRAA